MKVCTLIVRLIGLYLVFSSTVGLYQIQRAKSIIGGLGNPFAGDVIAQLLLGLVAVIFAAKLARFLTADAGADDR